VDRPTEGSNLKDSERKYRLLIELARQGILAINAAGDITFANTYMKTFLGHDPATLVNRSILSLVESDWAPVVSELFLKGRVEPVEQEEVRLLRADGKTVECLLNAGPMLDDSGALEGYTISITDLSETKSLREQLYESEKMSAIGRLAGGIAHEFNNIHGAIQGYVELMLREPTLAPQVADDLRAVRNLVRRAAHITQQLQVFARRETRTTETVDLVDLVNANVDIIEKEYASQGITVKVCHREEVRPVRVSAGRIGQVILELIMNAHDAVIDKGGEKSITVETGSEGERVFVRVIDTGRGVPSDAGKRIFDPFYTTKGALGGSNIPGTGLGLSVARAIIQDHQGSIEVGSGPNGGACFTIWLPGEKTRESQLQTRTAAFGPVAIGASIMIVEDETHIAQMLERALSGAGYKVDLTFHGQEAVRKIHGESFDLVLVDLQLPDLPGEKVLEEVAGLPDGIRPVAIAMTGKTALEDAEMARLRVSRVVRKPFHLETLFHTVYAALTEKPPR